MSRRRRISLSAKLPKPEVIAAPKKKKRVALATGNSRELIYRPAITGWTPASVEDARAQADSGQMMLVSDLCETMLRDARIKGVLSTRTHGLLGLPIEFDGGDPDARATLAGNTNGKNGEWFHMSDESEAAKLLRMGLMLGVGVAQRIELPRVIGRPHRYRIETWSSRWLSYYHYGTGGGSHWKIQTENGQEDIVPGDGKWILFQPYGARRPWAEGHWQELAFPWLLKHFSMEDRANFSEVLGSPLWLGLTAHNGTQKQRDKFLSQMRAMGKNGKFVLPQGWDLKLVEASSSGKSGDVFDQQIKFSNEEMTIALAGQLVTTEGTSGFSQGNVHEAIKQDLIRFDGERLATCLYEQHLEPWALWNYGSRKAAPWPKWLTEKPEDVSERADGLQKLGVAIQTLDAALKPHGLKTNAEELASQYNVPLLRADPDAPALPAPSEKAPTDAN
jgi:phage gp29-like protein